MCDWGCTISNIKNLLSTINSIWNCQNDMLYLFYSTLRILSRYLSANRTDTKEEIENIKGMKPTTDAATAAVDYKC